ncbi:MAG TPA: ankyrin repeat domain-containing protein [Pontiellaceae bacterium]|nr:ankyrin repeat domain-containing protein [Pontiellaceae bacterium]
MTRIGWIVLLLGTSTACAEWQPVASRINLFFMKAGDYFEPELQVELAQAADRGNVSRIKDLVKKGGDVNAQGKDGITPLLWALIKQNEKGLQALLEQGADPNIITTRANGEKFSVLHLAAIMENPDYLRLALEHGGNPNLVDPDSGKTPVYEAIMNRRRENIDLLIAAGANLNFKDRTGQTPAMIAAGLSQYDVVYEMIKAGADPKITDNWNYTVAWFIEQNPTDPEAESYKWRNLVIDLLRERGMEVLPWTPEKGSGRPSK